MATRLNRTEQVGRNRELLLEAARTVFLDRGYAGATLEAIAEEAGFSKGVVYSQFAGKADLFLALLERRIVDRGAQNARLVEGAAGGEQALRALLRTSARDIRVEAGWARLLIEFRAVAARDPQLNARYAALHASTIEGLAASLETALARDGRTTRAPVRTLAQLILALGSGAVLEQAADPAALPVEVLEDVISRFIT